MFAQEPPPDFDISCRREPGELPELVAEMGLVEVARATGEVGPVDRSGGVDREQGGGEAGLEAPLGSPRWPPQIRRLAEMPEQICERQGWHHAAGSRQAQQPARDGRVPLPHRDAE